MMIRVSAPGKCIIIGEHAVVYGEPEIIAAVGLRTTVTLEKSDTFSYRDHRFEHTTHFTLEETLMTAEQTKQLWNEGFEKKNFSPLFSFIKENHYGNYRKALIGILAKRFGVEHGLRINIHSEIPAGAGIGSSASLAVALTKAFAELTGKNLSLDEINEIAFELEQIIHGTPSGGDNSTSCYGGLVWFQKSQPKNIIQSLREEIPYKLENFVLVYTKPSEKNTGELVQMVRNLSEDYRNQRVASIGKMVHEMKDALKHKNFAKVKELINNTQKNLAELGVSIPEIDEIASAVKAIDGAAKLCGAGGGGIMLCYHEDKPRLVELIRDLGYTPLEADLAVEGVRLE